MVFLGGQKVGCGKAAELLMPCRPAQGASPIPGAQGDHTVPMYTFSTVLGKPCFPGAGAQSPSYI